MTMEKLKTSPANETPETGFLKSSGAVHSMSERREEKHTDAFRQLQFLFKQVCVVFCS